MRNIFLLLMFIFIFSCSQAKKEDTLVLGTNNMFPPFTYINGDDEIAGFDIELAKEIAKDMHKTLVIKIMDFDELWVALQNNQIDMAIRAITITEERKRDFDFSQSYYKTSQAALIRKSDSTFNGIRTKEALGESKTLAVERKTTASSTAKNITADDDAIVERNSLEFVLLELISENVDAIIVDKGTAQSFIGSYDNLTILPIQFDVEHYGVAITKGNSELAASINKTLDRLINSGQYLDMVEEQIHAYLLK